MNGFTYSIVVALGAAAPLLSGCQNSDTQAHKEHPAEVEHLQDSELSKLTLTERAIERLDVQTGEVTEATSPRGEAPQKAVAHSAIWYDPHGKTWIYTSPKPRVFIRAPIEVDHILNDVVYLKDGPDVGTVVATVGVAELYGTEFEVGH